MTIAWADLAAALRRGDIRRYAELSALLFDDDLPTGDFDALTAALTTTTTTGKGD